MVTQPPYIRSVPCDIRLFEYVWTGRAQFFLPFLTRDGYAFQPGAVICLYEWHSGTRTRGASTDPLVVSRLFPKHDSIAVAYGYLCIGVQRQTPRSRPIVVECTHAVCVSAPVPIDVTDEEYSEVATGERKFLSRLTQHVPDTLCAGMRIRLLSDGASHTRPPIEVIVTCVLRPSWRTVRKHIARGVYDVKGIVDQGVIVGFDSVSAVDVQDWGDM